MELSRRAVIAGGLSAGVMIALAACATEPKTAVGGEKVPRYSGDGLTTDPIAYLRTSWSTDPYSRGSYSYLAPSDVGTDAREMLAEPIGRLHFAGEATSSTAPATTHGAWESGQRVAAELMDSSGLIVIIGAGFAGLSAARALVDAGRDVVVVEGRDRTGGRAHTAMLNGVPADLGPSWIHGVTDNPMVSLARDAGVALVPFDYDNQVGGSASAEKFLDGILEQALEADDAGGRALSELLPPELSIEQQWAIAVNISGEFAADPMNLAMAAPGEGGTLRGGDALLNPGYSGITEYLARGLDIRLNWSVATVTCDDNEVSVVSDDGREMRADHAIVTLPVGVLHSGDVRFSPPLPTEKLRALDALQSGLLDKLWLEFDEVFWDENADVINWIDPVNPGHWAFWVNGYKMFGRPVLLGFSAGDVAREFAVKSDEELLESAMNAVRNMIA